MAKLNKRMQQMFTCEDCGAQFTATLARFCPNCRWKHRGKKATKYPWTPERDDLLRKRYDGKVKLRAAEIARSLGWPTWVIKKRAQVMGLAYPVDRKEWTAEEIKFILDYAGSRTSHWIANKLSRSETSVVLKCKRLKISRRVQIGYTLRELELCFGIDHHGIERWVKDGKLKDRKRHTARTHTGDIWCVSDEDIISFISNHPMAFRLDKVDQFWFMDLLLAGGLVKKALKAAAEEIDEEDAA